MPRPCEPKVHVVDDEAAVRDVLRELVESAGLQAALYASAEEFLAGADQERAGCLVLDICLGRMSGLDLQQELTARGLDLPVIIITGHADVPSVRRAFRQGALDVLQKPFDARELRRTLRTALAQHERLRTIRADRSAAAVRWARLSPRERQVLDMVVAGLANKQVAAALGLAERTVEFHRAQIMRKMGVASVARLVQMAIAGRDPGLPADFLSDLAGKRN